MDKSPFDIPLMKESVNENAPPLTKEETKNACAELIRNYPAVSRHGVDPAIDGQEITCLSFMLLKEPKNGVYGFVKCRGSHRDVDAATKKCETLIKEVDSVFPIHQAKTGYWVPITNNPAYSEDRLDVKTKEQEIALRDQAQKDQVRQTQQKSRELEEKKKEVETRDIDADPESLDFYTKKKVSQKELKGYIDSGVQKLNYLKKQLKKINKEVLEINKKHPVYIDQWLDNYNKSRENVGLPPITEEALEKMPVMGQM
jgi:hypothetical protein